MDLALCDDQRGASGQAQGYTVKDGTAEAGGYHDELGIQADGGLCASALTLAHLPQRLAAADLLPPDLLHTLRRPTPLPEGARVDYGFGVRRGALLGHPLWGHTGGMTTYWSALAHFPEDDLTVAVLTNTDGSAVDALHVFGAAATAALNLPEIALDDRPVTADEQASYAGTYDGSDTVIHIQPAGPRLRRVVGDDEETALILQRQGPRVFGRTDYPLDRLIFHVPDKEAVGFSVYYNGFFATYHPRVDEAASLN